MKDRLSEPLSIGVVTGGPGPGRAWINPLLKAMNVIADARDGDKTALRINVVFFIHGDLLATEFEGLRTGSFSRKHGDLMIQVALGEHVPEHPLDAIESYLHQAIDLALAFAKDEAFEVGDLQELHDIVNRAAAVW